MNVPQKPDPTLREALTDLIDNIVNPLLSLTQSVALFRFGLLLTGFLGIWLLLDIWLGGLTLSMPHGKEEVVSFLGHLLGNTAVWRYLLMLIIPFYLMREAAARYLDDIFELEDVSIAARFIDSAAFGIRYQTIHIREGRLINEHRNSPIYRIGGPGFVLIDLDSAALFEYADGRPHVLGPTLNWKNAKARLEGFERLRDTYDLRDHTYTTSVTSRSLDGIPISANDVRLVFSIWRGNQTPTLRHPHPFEPQALETLTYSRTARVSNNRGQTNISVWTTEMGMLIKNALRDFISRTPLNEFLASITVQEAQERQDLENQITEHGSQIAIAGEADAAETPAFNTRREISGRVTQRADLPNQLQIFAEEFTRRASQRGVELHWGGIGTWHHPSEIILEKHIEAWRINRRNILRTRPEALRQIRQDAYSRSMQDMMRTYLLTAYQPKEQKPVAKALTNLRYLFKRDSEGIFGYLQRNYPQNIFERAVKIIDTSLYHWINQMSATYASQQSAAPKGTAETDTEINYPNILAAMQQRLGENNVDMLFRDMGVNDPDSPSDDQILQLAQYYNQARREAPNASAAEHVRMIREYIQHDKKQE